MLVMVKLAGKEYSLFCLINLFFPSNMLYSQNQKPWNNHEFRLKFSCHCPTVKGHIYIMAPSKASVASVGLHSTGVLKARMYLWSEETSQYLFLYCPFFLVYICKEGENTQCWHVLREGLSIYTSKYRETRRVSSLF